MHASRMKDLKMCALTRPYRARAYTKLVFWPMKNRMQTYVRLGNRITFIFTDDIDTFACACVSCRSIFIIMFLILCRKTDIINEKLYFRAFLLINRSCLMQINSYQVTTSTVLLKEFQNFKRLSKFKV